MHAQKIPTAVRLLGFESEAAARLAALLAQAPASGPRYSCLHDDSLQEPDIYLADGSTPAALDWLDAMRCAPAALLIGGTPHSTYSQLPAALDAAQLHDSLARLLTERRRALALRDARGEPWLAERRRRPRCGSSAGCASERRAPYTGKVLIVDHAGALRDHLAGLVGERRLGVAWTDSGQTAVRLCDETAIALTLINTSATGIDPYDLARTIKQQQGAGRTAIVLLVGPTFSYDSTRAHGAGVRGLLDKPVADRSLVAVLQRLSCLPALRV